MRPLWGEAYRQMAEGPDLGLAYQPALGDECGLQEPMPAAQAAEALLLAALGGAREEDTARGLTTVGPHRDEVDLTFDGRSLRVFGSQGEQRTAAIALRLALARWIAEQRGEPPLLLLDDVLSELDAERRTGLLQATGMQEQTIITCTDWAAVPAEVREEAMSVQVTAGSAAAMGAAS